jgi:hypothetical protein
MNVLAAYAAQASNTVTPSMFFKLSFTIHLTNAAIAP